MSKKKRKIYSREFKLETVGLITKNGYSIAEASRNLGIEYKEIQSDDEFQAQFSGCAEPSESEI